MLHFSVSLIYVVQL